MYSIFPNFNELHANKRIKFLDINGEFFIYNVKDSLLIPINNLPKEFLGEVVKSIVPPVKTLILHTTSKCNFSCGHCYINAGNDSPEEMTSKEQSKIIKEFGEMGGLWVDLSGGEALLKKGIEDIIFSAREQKLRTFVLTNAGNLDNAQLKRIAPFIDGMAVSLDGLYDVNDKIRGQGTFINIVKGLEKIAENEIELSLTTLITSRSIPQLLEFPQFMEKYNVKTWSLVMPRPSGRFANNQEEINKSYELWDKRKKEGLLNSLHYKTKQRGILVILDHILVPNIKKKIDENSDNFVYNLYNKGRACWDNTLTIMPNGDIKCCLFFDGQIYNNVKKRSLRYIYQSEQRKIALAEFKKYPIDKCPFIEKSQLDLFNNKIRGEFK